MDTQYLGGILLRLCETEHHRPTTMAAIDAYYREYEPTGTFVRKVVSLVFSRRLSFGAIGHWLRPARQRDAALQGRVCRTQPK
jgi:hypothetical protein